MKELANRLSSRRYSMIAPSGVNVPIISTAAIQPEPVIEIPFNVAKLLFREHMLNILIVQGNKPSEAVALLDGYSVTQITEMISEIQKGGVL